MDGRMKGWTVRMAAFALAALAVPATAEMTLTGGMFGHYDADGESGSLAVSGTTSVRLEFGATWRPSGRRST